MRENGKEQNLEQKLEGGWAADEHDQDSLMKGVAVPLEFWDLL